MSLIAHWNAGRNDNANPNGEYVIVRNTGGTVVDLSGWILRDSGSTAWFTFPNGSVLTPDDYRVVHVGQGTPGSPNPRDLYMGSPTALLANVARDRFSGDGVYLLDPSTAFRSWFDWPCVVDCTDPAQGKLTITDVNPIATSKKPSRAANEEYIVIKNTSNTEINLDGYYLAYRSATYPFVINSRIPAGKTLTVFIGKGFHRSALSTGGARGHFCEIHQEQWSCSPSATCSSAPRSGECRADQPRPAHTVNRYVDSRAARRCSSIRAASSSDGAEPPCRCGIHGAPGGLSGYLWIVSSRSSLKVLRSA